MAIAGDDDFEHLREDIEGLRKDLEEGNLYDTRGFFEELDSLIERENDTLIDKINQEIRSLENVREELQREIQRDRKEGDLEKTIEEEWKDLIEYIENQDRLTGDVAGEITERLREIDKRLEKLLEIQSTELSDLTEEDSDLDGNSIAKLLKEDIQAAARTHQKIALYRQFLAQISKEAAQTDQLAMEGAYKHQERDFSDNVIPELDDRAVELGEHISEIQDGWLPEILEREEQLVQELEEVGEELQMMAEIDEELISEIEEGTQTRTSGGLTSISLYPGQLIQKLKEYNDQTGLLDEAMNIVENDIRPRVEKLEDEEIKEENVVEKMVGEISEHIGRHKSIIENERDRIDVGDTEERGGGPSPLDSYPAEVEGDAEAIMRILRDIISKKDGNFSEWDASLEAEVKGLRRDAEDLHRIEDSEIEDVENFQGRIQQVENVIESMSSRFEEHKRKSGISSVFELPSRRDLIGEPNRNPSNETTIESIVWGTNMFRHGLVELMMPEDMSVPDNAENVSDTGLVTKLEEDIEKLYKEDDSERSEFEEIEAELEDIREKLSHTKEEYESYEELLDDLEDKRTKDQVFTAAADKMFSGTAATTKDRAKRLENEIEEIESWMDRVEDQLESAEAIIYTDDDSVIKEEEIAEEELEESLRELMQTIDRFHNVLLGEGESYTRVPDEIASLIKEIESSLRNIAQRATSLRERDEMELEEFREWAEVLDAEREAATEMEDESESWDGGL